MDSQSHFEKTNDVTVAEIQQLPAELMLLIFEHLQTDYRTLYSLCLVNKFFCDEARRVMYRVMVNVPGSSIGPSAQILLANPHLARYLESYHNEHSSGAAYLSNSWDLLRPCASFRAMSRLKTLSFEGVDVGYPKNLLYDNTFQLETFKWNSWYGKNYLHDLPTLFIKQIKLKRIEADFPNADVKGPVPLPGAKDLEHLEGNRGAIELFLPGRHPEILIWKKNFTDFVGPIDHLAQELGTVKLLSLTCGGQKPNLPDLTMHCQNVEYLELSSVKSSEFESVHDFPRLVGLVMAWNPQTNKPHHLSEAILRKLFFRCPRLQFVDIEVKPMEHYQAMRTVARWLPPKNRKNMKKGTCGVKTGGYYNIRHFLGLATPFV